MLITNRTTDLHTRVGVALMQWRFFRIGGVWPRSAYSADAVVRAGLLLLRRSWPMWLIVIFCLAISLPAHASSELALNQGCFNCHGTPSKTSAPSFDEISAKFSKYQGQTDAAVDLAVKLRHKSLFGGIGAHERLSEENAVTLMRWLIDGAK